MPELMMSQRTRTLLAALLLTCTGLSGCAVVSVAGAVAGAAISVTGAVVSTGVTLTGKAVGAAIDAASSTPPTSATPVDPSASHPAG